MEKIQIEGAPLPAGHYSHGIVHHGFVFVSGQLPMNPVTREVETGAIEAQTELGDRRERIGPIMAVFEHGRS